MIFAQSQITRSQDHKLEGIDTNTGTGMVPGTG